MDPTNIDPTTKLPFELWDLILEHLPPSQLTTVAQVSKAFNQIVRGLFVWQTIWTTAELVNRETSNEHQDFYERVLAFSKRICESCYCYLSVYPGIHTFSRERSKDLLKISRFSDTRNLCNTCYVIRLPLILKRQEELKRYLGTVIVGAERCNLNLLPWHQCPYAWSGKQEDMQATVDFIFHESVPAMFEELLARSTRRWKLVLKLQKRGIILRRKYHTFQSSKYVKQGTEYSLDKAVESVTNLYWLRCYTEYQSIRLRMKRDADSLKSWHMLRPSYAQEEALKKYIRTRLKSSRWSSVEDDPDTPARPPSSLWSLIEKLSYEMCLEYAVDCISLNTLTPVEDAHTVADETLVQAIDDGSRSLEGFPWSTSLSTLPFSEGLKRLLGESRFDRLIYDCRGKLMIKNSFSMGIAKFLRVQRIPITK